MRICLLTDFGTCDPYVAAMKGVIAARTNVPIFDLSHEIAPFDVLEAAWFLRTVADYWPDETIFVAVVDPGVGTDRKIVAARSGGRTFLAPDNGLLSFIVNDETHLRSVENASLFMPGGSTTFHGRDRFAPVAASLANGDAFENVGPQLQSINRLNYEPPQYGFDRVTGTIVAIDRFGNLITDIERSRVGFEVLLEQTYAGAEAGPFLIVGSSGTIEISVANGSAAERLGVSRLERVILTRRPV